MKRRLAPLAAALLMTGCGGGIYLGLTDDNPPSVSLATASSTAAAGQSVHLVAAASDDDFVIQVDFYRLDTNGNGVYLGTDNREPFEWSAIMPAGTSGSVVRFFARAVDSAGQQTDSQAVSVTLQ